MQVILWFYRPLSTQVDLFPGILKWGNLTNPIILPQKLVYAIKVSALEAKTTFKSWKIIFHQNMMSFGQSYSNGLKKKTESSVARKIRVQNG